MGLQRIVGFCLLILALVVQSHAQSNDTVRVLIVVEGNSSLSNLAMGDGRQLAALLGHFQTRKLLIGVNQYKQGQLEDYDVTFYIGFSSSNSVPTPFLKDVFTTKKKVVWLGTGFVDFCKQFQVQKKFGFYVALYDTLSQFDRVRIGSIELWKGEPNTSIITITNRAMVKVLAHAYSTRTRKQVPYAIQAGNLIVFADSPFSNVIEGDRYLFFADYLHDILEQQHETLHSAIIRIEDVTPLDDPDKLRTLADILSSRNIPFLVGVVPFYVDPSSGLRVSLSDKPQLVDALRYMVMNGGTIVMHGVTHQYRGTTTVDYEFWDEMRNGPIENETTEGIARKIEMGLQEFMRNDLNPLVWETPHYTASFKLYTTVARYFSSACEQRLALENADYSQQFPYIIERDLFGQKIYPENLGYVPLDSNGTASRQAVQRILAGARANLLVRDGFASAFFHAFLDPSLLIELVEGLQKLGYTFYDVREHTNWVKTENWVILSGTHTFSLKLDDQYLVEEYYNRDGELRERKVSTEKFHGILTKTITLVPGEFYRAEPTEFRERRINIGERIMNSLRNIATHLFATESNWNIPSVGILWNHYARGALYNDQASLAAVFRSLNIPVDTIFLGQPLKVEKYNVFVVPFSCVDSLKEYELSRITQYVRNGGNLITDGQNALSPEFGIRFRNVRVKVTHVHDRFHPEKEIRWRYPQLAPKLEVDDVDEIFCTDAETETPLIVGKQYGAGRVLVLSTLFDAYSQLGYSSYPYLFEYVQKYFRIQPVVRSTNLEVYFDPGFRHTYSIEQQVKQWVNAGVRIIHAAGWHQYPKYTYDYDRLLRVAHANGLLVYLWLEPPQVSQKFWLEHPQWREKNYLNEDIRPSWRYPVALTDDSCLSAIVKEYETLLENHDWDGVNVAELYFEAARGLKDPKSFTPFHPSAQRKFLQKYNFPLKDIFDPHSPYYWKTNEHARAAVEEFRVQCLTDVYHRILSSIEKHRRKKEGFAVVVTALDSYGSPEVCATHGVAMEEILRLQKQYTFTLIVEDPEPKWYTSPLRYRVMGRVYKALVIDSTRYGLDLNIGTFRSKDAVTPFPTVDQTGIECYWLVHVASSAAPSVVLYSESSVNPQDFRLLSYAAACGVRYTQNGNSWYVSSTSSWVLQLPAHFQELLIDNTAVMPFRNNLYLIPTGSHTLTLKEGSASSFSTHELQARLLSVTGNLLQYECTMRSVHFEYESVTRTFASFDRVPTEVWVDGTFIPCSPLRGYDCYSILLPPGRHRVEVTIGDSFAYGVSLTSFWSSTAIAVFGFFSVSLLGLMYLSLKILRRKNVQE